MLTIHIGDVVTVKKSHPCGSRDWSVVRTGADVKLKCAGCGRLVMLSRPALERAAVAVNGTKITALQDLSQ